MGSPVDKIFKGQWRDRYYIVDSCPFCKEIHTFRFLAGTYECIACGHTGLVESLRDAILGHAVARITYGDIDIEDKAPEGLIDIADYKRPVDAKRVKTGFGPLDKMVSGLTQGMLSVLTGKRGDGKSTFAGQLALNAIDDGHPVCFYSGELNASMFQDWVLTQAAGEQFLNSYTDEFGAVRYSLDPYAESHIKLWLKGKMLLYDNSIVKSSERNTILERFALARRHYGCDVFFVDNLMTAKYGTDISQDFYRAQSNFVQELVEFAMTNNSHVFLIAHPRKGSGGDENDNVAGIADITNLASNVIRIKRLTEKEQDANGCDSMAEVIKNREFGTLGAIRLKFEQSSRRLVALDGSNVTNYGWEG